MDPVEVDLFASHLTTQLPHFYSWRPDPEAEVTDAFMHAGLDNLSGICQPTVVPDTSLPHQGDKASSTCSINNTIVENPVMVPNGTRTSGGLP